MKVTTARVSNGRVVADADPFPEGTLVKVVLLEDEPVSLTDREKEWLRESMASGEIDDGVDAQIEEVARGRVVNGRVEFEGDTTLPEGTEVEIRPFELTEEEEEELWQAHLEIERGEFVTAEDLLEELRSRRSE